MNPNLHPWPDGVKRCLISEGMEAGVAEAFATILKRAVTDISTFGSNIYEEHTPKRVALSSKLRSEGFIKSAALIWHDQEDREKVDWRVGIERLHHMYADVIPNDSAGARHG